MITIKNTTVGRIIIPLVEKIYNEDTNQWDLGTGTSSRTLSLDDIKFDGSDMSFNIWYYGVAEPENEDLADGVMWKIHKFLVNNPTFFQKNNFADYFVGTESEDYQPASSESSKWFYTGTGNELPTAPTSKITVKYELVNTATSTAEGLPESD